MRGELSRLSGEEIQVADPIIFRSTVQFTELPIIEPDLAEGATPSALNLQSLVLSNTSPTNVTNFTGGSEGQTLYVIGDGQSILVDGTNIAMSGGASKLAESGSVYQFIYYNSQWVEIGASSTVNPEFGYLGNFSFTLPGGSSDVVVPLSAQVFDLRNYSNVRLSLNYSISSPVAQTPIIRLKYATSFTGSYTTLANVNMNLNLSAGEYCLTGSSAVIPSGAQIQDCFLRLYVAPNFSTSAINFRVIMELT